MDQSHPTKKSLVYRGIALYNPNDHINDRYLAPLNGHYIPQKLSSSILIIPKKKRRGISRRIKKYQEQTKDLNNNNISRISTSTDDDAYTKYFVKGESKTEKKTHDAHLYSKSSKVHFSASGTQMLSDEGFDYFDISLYNFPSTPNFGAYLAGYFKENTTKDEKFLFRAKFGRRMLRPNYRLGKLPYRGKDCRQRVPVFLLQSAYNSELEFRLAEIDEAMRGHPPEKRRKSDPHGIVTSNFNQGWRPISILKDEEDDDEEEEVVELEEFSEVSYSSSSESESSQKESYGNNEKDENPDGKEISVFQPSTLTLSESNLVDQMKMKREEIHYVNLNPLESSCSEESEEFYENDDRQQHNVSNSNSAQNDLVQSESSQSVKSNFDSVGTENTNIMEDLSIGESKKASVFRSILGIFSKKESSLRRNEKEIVHPTIVSKPTFFQKLFRLSSEGVTKSLPTSTTALNNSPMKKTGNKNDASLSDPVEKDINGNITDFKNFPGPKHTDSVSLMRKKRLKFFIETQAFFQDSISAYRSAIMPHADGRMTPPDPSLTSTAPFPYPNPTRIPNQGQGLNYTNLKGVHFGYKSTMSESVIIPAISRRKRRLHQNLLDGFDENNTKLCTRDKKRQSQSQNSRKKKESYPIKGILKKRDNCVTAPVC